MTILPLFDILNSLFSKSFTFTYLWQCLLQWPFSPSLMILIFEHLVPNVLFTILLFAFLNHSHHESTLTPLFYSTYLLYCPHSFCLYMYTLDHNLMTILSPFDTFITSPLLLTSDKWLLQCSYCTYPSYTKPSPTFILDHSIMTFFSFTLILY